MLQKHTWLFISDNTNARWLKIFHLYKGFFRKKTSIGYFIKGSLRVVEPPRYAYKGFKTKFNKKGDICRSLIIRTKFYSKYKDSTIIKFKNNSGILIKKKKNPKSKYLYGPVSKNIKQKKLILLFPKAI